MAIDLDTQSATIVRKTYTYTQGPRVEVNLTVDQASNNAGMNVRISGATGAAQLKNVLQIIITKISDEFGV